jgi:hypothetical protein
MPATLKIREDGKGLTIRVTEPRNLSRVVAAVIFGSVVVLLLLHFVADSKLLRIGIAAVALLTITRGVIDGMRGTDVELTVDNLDLYTKGFCPEGHESGSTARADVTHMEYRKASGGGEDQELPEGLYVERVGSLWGGSKCMLPHATESQTNEVLEAIYRRFPDTGTLAPASAPTKSHLTTLNLSGL